MNIEITERLTSEKTIEGCRTISVATAIFARRAQNGYVIDYVRIDGLSTRRGVVVSRTPEEFAESLRRIRFFPAEVPEKVEESNGGPLVPAASVHALITAIDARAKTNPLAGARRAYADVVEQLLQLINSEVVG